jgi:hypothetical protein
MTPLPPVSGVLRVDTLWSDISDANVQSRLFYSYSGSAPDPSDAQSLAADVYGHAADLAANWHEQVQLTGVRVTDLSSSSGAVGEHEESTVGTLSGNLLPASACLLINYVVGRRYRGGKPRSYYPWGDASSMGSNNVWTTGFVNSVSTNYAAFLAAVIGLSSGSTTLQNHVNVSYYDGFTVVTNPVTGRARNVSKQRTSPVVDLVTTWAVSTRIRSQRRRLGR